LSDAAAERSSRFAALVATPILELVIQDRQEGKQKGRYEYGFSDGRVLFRPRLGDLAIAGAPGKLSRHA
jgi:hypothetical protein